MFSLNSGQKTGSYDETVVRVWLTRSSKSSMEESAGVPGRVPSQHIDNLGMGRKSAAGLLTCATVDMI